MSQLSAVLGFSTAGTTKVADRLAEAGMIERGPSAADRRVILVTLTEHGFAGRERGDPDVPRGTARARGRSRWGRTGSRRWWSRWSGWIPAAAGSAGGLRRRARGRSDGDALVAQPVSGSTSVPSAEVTSR